MMNNAASEKIEAIQQTIDNYIKELQVQPTFEMWEQLASAVLDKIEISGEFRDEDLALAQVAYQNAFGVYSDAMLTRFLHGSFRVLGFPFEDGLGWHQQFMKQFEKRAGAFANEDANVYLDWSAALLGVTADPQYTIPASYAEAINKKAVELMAQYGK